MRSTRKHMFFGIVTALFMAVLMAGSVVAAEPEGDGLSAMVERASKEFYENQARKEERSSEIVLTKEVVPAVEYETIEREFFVLTHGGQSMKFFMETIGDPDEHGLYPLYITLHGGGGGPEEENNDQWIDMFNYYRGAVENGIYIACRGITDTWDLHFQEDSYPLYDRLIEAMILNYGADPNRVYLLGFSAGGDGVYQISPRLADRFAAVNMSSGHPNGVRLLNLANCPISLHAGIRDYYDEDVQRSIRAAEFEKTLSDYAQQYGFGYEHKVYIHVPAGHNYDDNGNSSSLVLKDPTAFAARAVPEDMLDEFLSILEECGIGSDVSTLSYYPMEDIEEFDEKLTQEVTDQLQLEIEEVDANAVRYVSQYTRKAAPENLVWDLGTRASMREKASFYWLKADPSMTEGVITASCDPEKNTITVTPDEHVNGDFAILLHPNLIDPEKPVTINTPKGSFTVNVTPSEDYLKQSMLENGDPCLGCYGEILYSSLGES